MTVDGWRIVVVPEIVRVVPGRVKVIVVVPELGGVTVGENEESPPFEVMSG